MKSWKHNALLLCLLCNNDDRIVTEFEEYKKYDKIKNKFRIKTNVSEQGYVCNYVFAMTVNFH